jgi:hypothetical protein
VLLGWNALFLSALTEAAAALGRDDWMTAARTNATFLLNELQDDFRFRRSWRAPYLAYAEDYAALLEALVTLTELDDVTWLGDAQAVAGEMIRLFQDRENGGFFTTGARRRGARGPIEGSLRRRDAVGKLVGRQRLAPARGDPRRTALRSSRDRDPRNARGDR